MNENNCLAKDVVVIGAGPAGSMCAYLLKKAGVECVLIDRATFPREKVCGGSLTHKAYTLLAETMPDLKYDYYPVRKLKLILAYSICVDTLLGPMVPTAVSGDRRREHTTATCSVWSNMWKRRKTVWKSPSQANITAAITTGFPVPTMTSWAMATSS